MKYIKKYLAILLSIAMVMCSTLPSLASENDALQETTESKIVEQLKEDLGEERAEEILSGKTQEEEESSIGELCELEESDEDEEELTEVVSEPEEDEIEVEKESEILDLVEKAESEVLESDENSLNDEIVIAETEEAISETEIIESSEVESNDDEVVVATDSEIQDSLLDLHEIVSLSSNEKLLGAGEPWMWWYLTDEGHTIHYTNSEPSVGGHGITTTGESTIKDQYSTLNIGDITNKTTA